MRTPDRLGQRRVRRRRRFGLRKVSIEISQEGVELLEKRGYLLGTKSDAAIGLAATALLSDLVLEVLKSDRVTLVFEAIGNDMVRVNCANWDDPKVMLPDEALKVVA